MSSVRPRCGQWLHKFGDRNTFGILFYIFHRGRSISLAIPNSTFSRALISQHISYLSLCNKWPQNIEAYNNRRSPQSFCGLGDWKWLKECFSQGVPRGCSHDGGWAWCSDCFTGPGQSASKMALGMDDNLVLAGCRHGASIALHVSRSTGCLNVLFT